MPELERKNVDVFERDAASNDGYLYTHTDRLSCRLATGRTTDIILGAGIFKGKTVLDAACGDAFYTRQFSERGGMAKLVATDAAVAGVQVGSRSDAAGRVCFLAADAHRLPFAEGSFDVVLLQSVLHHDDRPSHMIAEAFRVGHTVAIHEPNGNNLGLKVIERLSRYHREHRERSYTSLQMRRWIEAAGGRVVYWKMAGFVPMFCPDWMAKAMKLIEPVLESIPVLRSLMCSVYIMVGVRNHA